MRDGWRMLMEKESLWYKVLVGLNREEGEERKLCKNDNKERDDSLRSYK